MAKQGGWSRFVGGAVNALLPGTPYSRYSGYDPTLTRNSIISGVAGQLVPGGGALAQTLLNQTGSAQAATAGQQGLSGLMGASNAANQSWQQGNQNFDSSGIQAEFAPINAMDLSGYDPNAPAPPQPTQSSQQPPTSLAGLAVGGPQRDNRSGSSAGSSVLAEGQAAQDMVGGWQLGNWLNMKAPAGPGRQYRRQA